MFKNVRSPVSDRTRSCWMGNHALRFHLGNGGWQAPQRLPAHAVHPLSCYAFRFPVNVYRPTNIRQAIRKNSGITFVTGM